MKSKVLLLLLALSVIISGKEYKLFYLGGQSNMQGFGNITDLPDEYNKMFETIRIFNANWSDDNTGIDGKGIWDALKPGYGYGSKSDGTVNILSDKFGPELTFGIKIQELFPDDNIAILKYAKGGSSIEIGASKYGSWNPDYFQGNNINQWDHFLAAVNDAMSVKDIDGDGEEDKLTIAGIIWMQGESDADNSEENARKYEANLAKLLNMIRAAFRVDDIPVVIGKIADSAAGTDKPNMPAIKYVWEGEENYVKNDPNSALVEETLNYSFVDRWHFDSAGQIDLGIRFAEKVFGLIERP